MALKRKPVQCSEAPDYPDAENYSAHRRDFLIKLGISAAGLLGLAGCGSGATSVRDSHVQSPDAPDRPRGVVPRPVNDGEPLPPPRGLVRHQPADDESAKLPPLNQTPDGSIKTCPAPPGVGPETASQGGMPLIQPPIAPKAPMPGSPPPAQPLAPARGESKAPELPARPVAPSKGDALAPKPLAYPQSDAAGGKPRVMGN